MIKKMIIIFIVSLFCVYCLASNQNKPNFSTKYLISDIKSKVSEQYKEHPDAAFCDDFKMTEQQIRTFFSKSKIITSQIMHNEYYWSPCYFEGKLVQNDKTFVWKIYASKVGEISDENGNTIFLGCKSCKKPFFNF